RARCGQEMDRERLGLRRCNLFLSHRTIGKIRPEDAVSCNPLVSLMPVPLRAMFCSPRPSSSLLASIARLGASVSLAHGRTCHYSIGSETGMDFWKVRYGDSMG